MDNNDGIILFGIVLINKRDMVFYLSNYKYRLSYYKELFFSFQASTFVNVLRCGFLSMATLFVTI